MKEYHVHPQGNDQAAGTQQAPFQTISRAAEVAWPGDRVIVHQGVYREWVKPARGGTSDVARIVFEAAPGEKPVIKGSEVVRSWTHVEGNVWQVVLPNSFFGEYNPYQDVLHGDWLVVPREHWHHPGDVYLNGKSLYEARTLEEVKNPVMRRDGHAQPWIKQREPLLHPEDSLYQWCTFPQGDSTVICANFQGKDPNEELVEIQVRPACFYPLQPGCNYITVRGFEMAHAATPWSAATADQMGLIGPHWSKGWIIEHNEIHDSKCIGISLGKDAATGHNPSTAAHRKSGYQYQMEAVFQARHLGWGRERVGSHVVRYNTIYNCGQNGIGGNMGGAFCEIHHNEIYNIGVKHEFFGHEIAGIKLHAAIDTQIHHNRIHHCSLGTWLDWQGQGIRMDHNLYYENCRDVMLEVLHGPFLVDHNIFASAYNLDNAAQGGAYLHNLFCGCQRKWAVPDRSTPYHVAHSTEVAGSAFVYGGDNRIQQNIFVGDQPILAEDGFHGTWKFDGAPVSLEEFAQRVVALGNGDEEEYVQIPQPMYVENNAYLGGAKPFEREQGAYEDPESPSVKVTEDSAGVYLEMNVPEGMLDMATRVLRTEDLGMPRIVEAPFDGPHGEMLTFDQDYLGCDASPVPTVGPIQGLKPGHFKVRVWEKN